LVKADQAGLSTASAFFTGDCFAEPVIGRRLLAMTVFLLPYSAKEKRPWGAGVFHSKSTRGEVEASIFT
jgi:hypothetical protein